MQAQAAPQAAPADLVELGAVRGAWGVKGWARIAPFSADAGVLLATKSWWLLDPEHGPRPLQVQQVRRHGANLIAKWEGCETPEAADALRSLRVAVSRAMFPPTRDGEYYWIDLIGAVVVNRGGTTLGTVTALRSNGAQDLLEVTPAAQAPGERERAGAAATLLIPLVEDYVERVDIDARRIEVDWEPDW